MKERIWFVVSLRSLVVFGGKAYHNSLSWQPRKKNIHVLKIATTMQESLFIRSQFSLC